MNDDSYSDPRSAFDAAFLADPTQKTAADPDKRRKAERKHRQKRDDGRSKRATGRTAQLNIKLRPELRKLVIDTSRDHRKLISVIFEEAFADWLAKQSPARKRGRT